MAASSLASTTATGCRTCRSRGIRARSSRSKAPTASDASTQIRLLREWLEVQGYGVVETGWTRSELMQPTIELAKSSNTLNKLTFVLLYATDFADRLEKEIIPALKAGFIVLADRYIFTALARAGVRGVDRPWLRSLYGFAIAPHLVFYLKIDVDTLIRRVLRVAEAWTSGNRAWTEDGRRHLRQLPDLPEQAPARVRVDGRRVRFPRPRRQARRGRHSGRASPPGAGLPEHHGFTTGTGGERGAGVRRTSIA